jgi:hypothetical protein
LIIAGNRRRSTGNHTAADITGRRNKLHAVNGAIEPGDIVCHSIFVSVSYFFGRFWFYVSLAAALIPAFVIHAWWLPRNGIIGYTANRKINTTSCTDGKSCRQTAAKSGWR